MRSTVLPLPASSFRRFALLATLALGASLLLAACSGDDNGGDTTNTETATMTETSTATETGTATETATATETGTATASATQGGGGDAVSRGEELVKSSGCTACHGAGISPAFDEIGQQVTLENGDTVQVDAAYLHESIVDPNAKIVKGYSAGLMPQNFGDTLSSDDIDAIVQYILSLNQ